MVVLTTVPTVIPTPVLAFGVVTVVITFFLKAAIAGVSTIVVLTLFALTIVALLASE
jgi:hypothetical protein